jgi:hypothetical protein
MLEYLINFRGKVDLNFPNGHGDAVMDWTEEKLMRQHKGSEGYRLIEAIRSVISDLRLGDQKAKFTCEITGSCYCYENHTFGHPKSKSCPPTRSMIGKLL